MIKSTILAIPLVLGTGAIAKPVEPQQPAPTERVSYEDLDLGSTAARAILTNRIRAAANRVCDVGGMQTMEDFALATKCYTGAVKDGLSQADQLIAANRSGSAVAASALIVTAPSPLRR